MFCLNNDLKIKIVPRISIQRRVIGIQMIRPMVLMKK